MVHCQNNFYIKSSTKVLLVIIFFFFFFFHDDILGFSQPQCRSRSSYLWSSADGFISWFTWFIGFICSVGLTMAPPFTRVICCRQINLWKFFVFSSIWAPHIGQIMSLRKVEYACSDLLKLGSRPDLQWYFLSSTAYNAANAALLSRYFANPNLFSPVRVFAVYI